MSKPPRLALEHGSTGSLAVPETPPAVDASRAPFASRQTGSPGSHRPARSPANRMRSPPQAPARSPVSRQSSREAQRPSSQRPPLGVPTENLSSSMSPERELQKLARENAKLRRRLEAQRSGGRRGAGAVVVGGGGCGDGTAANSQPQLQETDMLIEELSKEIVELTDENKQLHRYIVAGMLLQRPTV